jgi:phosphonate transport system permease protein
LIFTVRPRNGIFMVELDFKLKRVWNKYKKFFIGLVVVLIYYWALGGTDVSIFNFIDGIPHMINFILRMFPPDFTNIGKFLLKTIETLQMAIIGSTIGALVALPLSFLAARNVMPNKIIYNSVRGIFDIFRGINEIVWGLIFVSMVGLGPFPGVLALSVHVTGALGRYFSEAIETVDPEIIKAIVSTGASKTQTVVRGIIPQVKPSFINYILYYLENNFRSATVLGLVGAGGIGMELLTSMRLFRSNEVLTILIIMVSMVLIIDKCSAYIRKNVINIEVVG